MGDTIRKKVEIGVDASSMQEEMARVSASGNELYERLKREAAEYSDELEKQSIYIDKNLALEKRRLEQSIQYRRNELTLRRDEELASSSKFNRKDIEKDYKQKFQDLNKEFISDRQNILDAKIQSGYDYNRQQKEVPTVQESNVDINRSITGAHAAGIGAARMGMSLTKTMIAGMGLGIAFGIGGILNSMVENAVELDKSSKTLDATMSNLDRTMLSGASSIGKTTSEMYQLTKEVAVITGGTLGRRGTGDTALFAAQYAKAYGLDDLQVVGTLATSRITGSNMTGELTSLLRELLSTGVITKNNFAQLGEKLDFWSRLNNMQASQSLTVSPFRSTSILSAFQGTGLSVLSDQRQIEFIQTLNDSIKNPKNDYMNSYVLRSLDRGKGLVDTLIRQEQGITGEGNLSDIFSSLKRDFGSGNRDAATMTLKSFTGSIQTAQLVVDKLFNNKDAWDKFEKSLTMQSKYSKDYEEAKTDKERNEILKKWLREESEFNRQNFGVTNTEALSKQRTGVAESLKSQLTNLSATSGLPIIGEIAKTMNSKDMQEALKMAAGALSYVGAEIIKVAAGIFIEGAKIFKEAVTWFTRGTAEQNRRYGMIESDINKMWKSGEYSNEEMISLQNKIDYRKDKMIKERSSTNSPTKDMSTTEFNSYMLGQIEDIVDSFAKNHKAIENKNKDLFNKTKENLIKQIDPKDRKEVLEYLENDKINRNEKQKAMQDQLDKNKKQTSSISDDSNTQLINTIAALNNTMLTHTDRVKKANDGLYLRNSWTEYQTGKLANA